LPTHITEKQLFDLFSTVGQVRKADILQSRQIAFVDFAEATDASKCFGKEYDVAGAKILAEERKRHNKSPNGGTFNRGGSAQNRDRRNGDQKKKRDENSA
jgi:hypothetical protein